MWGVVEGVWYLDWVVCSVEVFFYECYLWDIGFYWGEWFELMFFGVDVDFGVLMVVDKGDVVIVFYCWLM